MNLSKIVIKQLNSASPGYLFPGELGLTTRNTIACGTNTGSKIVSIQSGLMRPASEPLVAGDLVNLWRDRDGRHLARKADRNLRRMAIGYCLNDAAIGEEASIATAAGSVLAVSSPAIGRCYLGEFGQITTILPVTGSIQIVGDGLGDSFIFKPSLEWI